MRKYLLLNVLHSSLVIGQGINPLKWYPVSEVDNFIDQTFHKVCVGTDILTTDGEECNLYWQQHQIEVDIDNDGDMDFITQVYEDWHSGFQGVGVFENINNLDSNNVFILDTVYKQCGSHGGISAGFFNDDDFIDFYVSTGNYHGPPEMKPDLGCLEQDFFYLGSEDGFIQDTIPNSIPNTGSMYVFGMVQDAFDINNDGIDEILTSGFVPGIQNQQVFILSYNDDIQNFDIVNTFSTAPDDIPWPGAAISEWRYGDINGDGYKDMVSIIKYPNPPILHEFYVNIGNENGINIENSELIGSVIAPYGVHTIAGDEDATTMLDYDGDGDMELLVWWVNSFDYEYLTVPIDSMPQAELRLYDLQGDTLIDITDEAFLEGDNKDFNEPGNGVFIKDLNNDGIDDILFSTTWCLDKVNISGIDPGEPETIGEEDCATFALNLGNKFHLYDVEPTGIGATEPTSQQTFSIELDRYENDAVIYLSTTVEHPIWHYSNQIDKINFNSYVDSINADTIQTISWEGDIVSDIYRLQLSLDEFDLDLVLDTVTTDTMMIIDDLLSESEYYIRVRGENEAGEGLWSDTLTFTTIFLESDKEKSFLPKKFSLHQNYPNPFNPITTLKYDLPEDEFVSITIYDMLGNVINNLVNDNQNSGYKSVQWNATNNQGQQVSAGVYLYSIEAGEFRQTKKMILLK